MRGFRRADWYESPHYYDILLAPDSEPEADFLEAVRARHGLSKGCSVLEPACGSGRLLVAMSRRGWRVTGVDLSEPMVAYARRQLASAGLAGWLWSPAFPAAASPRSATAFTATGCSTSTSGAS